VLHQHDRGGKNRRDLQMQGCWARDGRSLLRSDDGDGDANVATMTRFGSQRMRPGALGLARPFLLAALLRNCGLAALPAASAADFTAVCAGGTLRCAGVAIQMLRFFGILGHCILYCGAHSSLAAIAVCKGRNMHP